jgi:hypothetical protein
MPQKLLMQFLRHLPIHHPEIEVNNTKIPKLTKSVILKETSKRKKGEWHGTACNERFGAMAGVPRWIGNEKQQVKWLVASAGSPPLRQAATTL